MKQELNYCEIEPRKEVHSVRLAWSGLFALPGGPEGRAVAG